MFADQRQQARWALRVERSPTALVSEVSLVRQKPVSELLSSFRAEAYDPMNLRQLQEGRGGKMAYYQVKHRVPSAQPVPRA